MGTATSATHPTAGTKARAYGNYVGGEWTPAASGKTFENRNPADNSDLIGTFAETSESVAAVSNLLMVPMAFLSGAFIPLESMPGYLQDVSRLLPLRYLNDAVLAALNGDDAVGAAVTACAVLLGFTVLLAAVLLKVFRWSPRR